jgi:hypothetical protein
MTQPAVAIINASSDKKNKFSSKSIHAHLNAGYDVYPVNPKEKTIEGLKCYNSLLDMPIALDRIRLYIPPAIGIKVLNVIAKKGCKEFWVNLGAESLEPIEKAQGLCGNAICGCSFTDARRHTH